MASPGSDLQTKYPVDGGERQLSLGGRQDLGEERVWEAHGLIVQQDNIKMFLVSLQTGLNLVVEEADSENNTGILDSSSHVDITQGVSQHNDVPPLTALLTGPLADALRLVVHVDQLTLLSYRARK